jgi:O-antigen/teichoic acid export membrane protein
MTDSVWLGLGQIFTAVCSYLFIYYFAKNLTLVEYGELSLVLTITSLITGLAMGGISIGAGRYYADANEKMNLYNYIKDIKNISYQISILLSIIGILIILLVYFKYQINIYVYLLALLFSLIYSLNNLIISIQNAQQDRKMLVSFTIIEVLLKLSLPIILVTFFFENKVFLILIGMIVSVAFVTLLRYKYVINKILKIIKNEQNKDKYNYKNKIMQFSYPFIIWGIFGWLQQGSIKWMLGFYGSLEDVATYTLIFQIGYTPIILLGDLIMSIALPILYNHKERFKKIIIIITALLLLLFLILLLIISFNGVDIMNFLMLDKYLTSFKYIHYIIISSFIFVWAQILSSFFYISENTKYLMFPSILSSIIGIFAAVMLINLYDIKGACYASIIHSLSYLILVINTTLKKKNDIFKI